jgi:hypothetical protein
MRPTKPIIERRYQGEQKPCMQAVEMLLKQAGVNGTGGRDGRIKHDPATPILPRR